MTNLTPTPGWDDVYQLEVTDPAQGGAGGIMNRQAQALLNRAEYLNAQFQAAVSALNLALGGKAPLVHQHDASALVSGVLDPARIPVLPSQTTVISSGDLTALTAAQQGQVVQGVIVTTTDGWRWVYTGSGDKTLQASYIQLADITPDWGAVQNKPASFPPSPHDHAIADVTGLQTALASTTPDWTAVQNKPSSFPPSPHDHAITDVTGLQDALNGKANASTVLFTDINGASAFLTAMIASQNGQCNNGSALTLPSFGACAGLGLVARPARTDEIATLIVGEHSVGWGSGGEATGWTDTYAVDPVTLAVTATRAITSGGGGANSGGTGSVNYSVICIRRYA